MVLNCSKAPRNLFKNRLSPLQNKTQTKMVIGAFPIAKLSVLLIKQISKPIANACKERAKSHPFFRTYVCLPPAQFYNWCEVKAKMWVLNLGRPVNIPVLSQDAAIELGANLLGEAVIFIIGAGLLIIEYNRQSRKEAAKEAARAAEMERITANISDLFFTVQHQQTQLKEMERLLLSMSGKKPDETPTPTEEAPSKPPTEPTSGLKPPPGNLNPSGGLQKFSPASLPSKGVLLQSLDYIQMDVFSSLFSNNDINKDIANPKPKNKQTENSVIREPGMLSEVLYYIENNCKSLF